MAKERVHYYSLIREVQDRIIQRYINSKAAATDSGEAREIQTFLQALKAMRLQQMKSTTLTQKGYSGVATVAGGADSLQKIIDAYGDTEILNAVYDELARITHNRGIFIARGSRWERGNELEQDLRDVLIAVTRAAIEATLKDKAKVTSKLRSKNTVQIGGLSAQTANSGLTQMVDELGDITAKEAIQTLANELGAKLTKSDKYSDRYGKIDVTGENILKLTASFNIKPEFLRLLTLLGKATFTAKNYASRSIKDLAMVKASGDWKNAEWTASGHNELMLGDTMVDKALRSALGGLGYSGEIVDKLIYGAGSIIAKGNNPGLIELTTKTFQQLRFIYELTGLGQSFKGFSEGTARFLVYNDPTGDPLYVVSTNQLIQEELRKSDSVAGIGKVKVAKSTVARLGS